ncbi:MULTISPECIES: chromosomal replication initiator protein DnaA [Microbacterium]|jgi:chromosomal replication initiator protein|uniref:Chromosomal replication initiator protein DnaA n=1 Tax=Microbacterium testaceum TaxID=2033 RepID=A0A147F8V9_MICTE|nr:chromosomal replication initiator protein DnaA [Microbacterium testaceum]KTS05154.1 chromosomal replication initiator protein DnaA [Microbacterium testaceum]KTS13019.1 chromosomal replication initiator protein DnaA [Microbacterium testaceum]KTS57229.1 chromosomal replication initiator protein DnaA [Microbacterium testaceum]KTS92051.1 chromosomal replication initiator protein DnaA [Microbacterium testaceum]
MSLHEVPDVPVWSAVLDHLLEDERVTPQLHGFLNLAVPQGVMGGTLYLDVPNDLTAAQMNKRMRAPILEALTQVQGSDPEVNGFRVVVNPDLIDSPRPAPADDRPAPAPAAHSLIPEQAPEPIVPASRSDTRLNPKYTFDNFVIGQSNRFAHAAAVAVAEAPAKAYNPLFIYGDSGLGKTHLLHAIGDYAASMYAGIRVRYVSSEEFTNDFINSIANNRGSAFQARYRDVDILLIDDIQFLQGRAETQEAFFHTFNTLHDHDKQVVITSDLPPKQLTGFEDRMRSRFEWGLITDVQAPDLETRIAILRKKAQSERLLIPDDVLEYIATVVSSNIRELEGALIRVSAFASLNRSTLDMSLAQTVLRDIIDQDDANVVSPTDIITATAQYFKLSVDDLYGSSRSQAVATARQIAMYLCRERTSLSLPKIGQLFGNRDHTTVMYAYKKISDLMKERRSIFNQVSEITSQLGRMR